MAKPRAVAAIDLGSTKSGYAFTYYDPKNIEINAFDYDDNYEKTDTTLLLKGPLEDLKFMAFGKEANEKLAYPPVHSDPHVYGFNQFKMDLYGKATKMVSHNGVQVHAVDVISHSLQFIAGSALEHMNRKAKGKMLHLDDIQWIVTVPAIWSNGAKQIMHSAAVKAGIPESRLIMALEPEAAAIHCKMKRTDLKFSPGTRYTVVDCGGGTVDMVFHEIDPQGNTQELLSPTGGPWGSTMVDKNFQSLMADIFGADQIEENKFEMPSILSQFELRKMIFSPGQRSEVEIGVGDLVPRHLDEYNTKNNSSIKFGKRRIHVPPPLMISLFSKPIDNIAECIKKSLTSIIGKPMDYIFLVGGFARNPILIKRIQSDFENETTKVICPDFPHTAVAEGAVHFGINPNIITSRFSSFTYGIRGKKKFNNKIDQKDHLENVDGVDRCKNTFFTFVSANERIPQGYEVSQFYSPIRKNQTKITFPIFASVESYEHHISESMAEVGKIVVDLPKEATNKRHKIKITMTFAGPEITVTAEHLTTGKVFSTKIPFSFVGSLLSYVAKKEFWMSPFYQNFPMFEITLHPFLCVYLKQSH